MLPNFLYIGSDKSGSTWIYEALRSHPDIYVPKVKDIYYFDRYYDKGQRWYESFFASAQNQKAVGELSHDYMYSVDAARRIKKSIPGVKLLVCLRNPVDRAISSYKFHVRLGLTSASFDEASKQYPDIISYGYYFKALSHYFRIFDRAQIFVLRYENLTAHPAEFAARLFGLLGVTDTVKCPVVDRRILRAGLPRNVVLAKAAKRTAVAMRQVGLVTLVGQLKNSSFVQGALYKASQNDIADDTLRSIRDKLTTLYRPDVVQLAGLLEMDLSSWCCRSS